ncbi:MAG: GNAT family N-acetyltransferase [Clostridia bacterium]|nr:GNAT family N-acetyltransferase [Clostridia bacterium]
MIREIEGADRELFLKMTKAFYTSDAVMHDIPDAYREATWAELMRSRDYAEGYIFEQDSKPVGYALLAKTFSQEAGGQVIWVEELYVLPEYRSKGLGREFFAFLKERKNISRVRLEVEPENERAVKLYEKMGFEVLPYMQMIIEQGISSDNADINA